MEMKLRNVKKVSDAEITCEIEHPDFGWIPYTAVKDSVEDEMMAYVWKTAYKKTLPKDLEILKLNAYTSLFERIKFLADSFTVNYTEQEVALWSTKRTEAEKVLAGGTSEILSLEASLTGETEKAIAEKIIAKNDAYRLALVKSETLKKNFKKEYETVSTEAELAAYIAKYERILKND